MNDRMKEALLRARAKKFVLLLMQNNLAMPMPEEWAKHSDEDIKKMRQYLLDHPGISQRSDFKFEVNRNKM